MDTGPALMTLAQLEKLEVVPVDGRAASTATSSLLVVVSRAGLPEHVAVAYMTVPLDDVWRAALSNVATIVDLSASP